jgi:hypothetical protein
MRAKLMAALRTNERMNERKKERKEHEKSNLFSFSLSPYFLKGVSELGSERITPSVFQRTGIVL